MLERLEAIDPWLRSMARRYARDPIRADDLAQEARIAVWKEVEKADASGREVNDSFLKQRAKWTILNHYASGREVPAEDAVLDSPAPIASGDLAYHRQEILAAIEELSPRQREYTILRFWGDLQKPELRDRGYGVGLWYRPETGARAKLAKKLAHLAPLAMAHLD